MKALKLFVASTTFALASFSCAQKNSITEVELKNDVDSISYSLGLNAAAQVKMQLSNLPFVLDSTEVQKVGSLIGFSEINDKYWEYVAAQFDSLDVSAFKYGFQSEVAGGDKLIDIQSAMGILQEAAGAKHARANIEKGKQFLTENAKRDVVITTASGLQYEILKESNGPIATAADQVKCHYEGKLLNGNVFDSSFKRGQPATFGVTQVIKGWTEALQIMPTGSKWRLYIPSDLAYGNSGAGRDIGPGETLIFDLELIEVIKN